MNIEVRKNEIVIKIDKKEYEYYEDFSIEACVDIVELLKEHIIAFVRNKDISIEIIEKKRGVK